MKKTTFILYMALMALMGTVSAQNATVTYNSSRADVNIMDYIAITPTEGEVESLQSFVITFGGYAVTVNEDAVPTLGDMDGGIMADDEGTTVFVDFEESITEPGNYELKIPGNTIFYNGEAIDPLLFRYSIKGNGFYDQITIDPAEGEVQSLQNFTITFPAYVGEIEYGATATLTNTTTGTVTQGEMTDVGFKVIAYFPDEITEPGEYVLTIPKGAVIIYTIEGEVNELNFHYTIPGGSQPDVNIMDHIAITPAEGEVESLQNFVITFGGYAVTVNENAVPTLGDMDGGIMADDEGTTVFIDFEESITEPGNYELKIPGNTIFYNGKAIDPLLFRYSIKGNSFYDQITIDPAEGEVQSLQNFTITFPAYVGEIEYGATATLTNTTTGTVTQGEMTDVGFKVIAYFPDEITEPGEYVLTIPKGAVVIYTIEGEVNELNFHYTIPGEDEKVVIEEQPIGEMVTYRRSGKTRYLYEEGETEEDYFAEVRTGEQDGLMNIVYSDDNVVYLQQPVSACIYDGWVKGTLSADGKQITVPTGQLVAYTKSFDMGVEIALMSYDEAEQTYVADTEAKEVVYTIDDDGTIRLTGTRVDYVLGAMNRCYGETFWYLDGEWIGGDFESVYTPSSETIITPPADLETTELIALSTQYLGEWEPYRETVKVGYDGNDFYVQGLTNLLPYAWVKGNVNGQTITIPSGQYLGTYYGTPLYLIAYPIGTDITMEVSEEGVYTSRDNLLVSLSPTDIAYVVYYLGMVLQPTYDVVVSGPENGEPQDYILQYFDGEEACEDPVTVVFDGNDVYVQGISVAMPEAWVKGTLSDGKVVFQSQQFLGDYTEQYDEDEYSLAYPVYFQSMDADEGTLQPAITFVYEEGTGILTDPDNAICIGINKTQALYFQELYDAMLIPQSYLGITTQASSSEEKDAIYVDMAGRRVSAHSRGLIIRQSRNADGSLSVKKILNR